MFFFLVCDARGRSRFRYTHACTGLNQAIWNPHLSSRFSPSDLSRGCGLLVTLAGHAAQSHPVIRDATSILGFIPSHAV